MIVCKSRRSAERTLRNIIPFIEGKLFLKVNREKTQVSHVSKTKFLGYTFYRYKRKGRLRAHSSSIQKMKRRIKLLTSRSNGWGDTRRKEELNQYVRGWVNYFKMADLKGILRDVDTWYRRRLRMCIWKQWKRVRTRLRMLMRLGLNKSKAWEYANTRKSYWHTANSYILTTSITTQRLKKAGYPFFLDYYLKIRT